MSCLKARYGIHLLRITWLLHHSLQRGGHCEQCGRTRTGAMRHFRSTLGVSLAPRALAGRMPVRSAAASLITLTRPTQRGPPLTPRARPGAVHMAVITLAANARPSPTTAAAILPPGLLGHRAPSFTAGWTTPCDARIKRRRQFAHTGSTATEGPGSAAKPPGPSSLPPLRIMGLRDFVWVNRVA